MHHVHRVVKLCFSSQIVAALLIMAAIVVLCVLVHILINLQRRTAFDEIEKTVATHLDIEKENSQQVSMHIYIYTKYKPWCNDVVFFWCNDDILSLIRRRNFCCLCFLRMWHMPCKKDSLATTNQVAFSFTNCTSTDLKTSGI